MVVTPEQTDIVEQTRQDIDRYVAQVYFAGKVVSCNEVDVLTTKPVDDPELQRMYDDANGNATHYALKLIIDGLHYRYDRVRDNGTPDELDGVRQEMQTMISLDKQFTDPHGSVRDSQPRP